MKVLLRLGLGLLVGCPAPAPQATDTPAKPVAESPVQTSKQTPVTPPSAATGHCAAGEQVWFDCPITGGKRVSLCGGPGAADAQYRFGAVGSPELVFPAAATGGKAAFKVEERTHIRSQGTVAVFENEGHRYEVSSYAGGGGGADAESNNFQGVYVFKGDELLATVSCSEHPTMQLDEWGG